MRPKTVTVVVMLLVVLAAARALAEETSRRYVETHGPRRQVVAYGITPRKDGFDVSSVGETSAEHGRWVTGTGLVSWEQSNPAAGNDLHATREGDTIRVTGTLRGKPVSRAQRVDSAPWYQIFGPAMKDLLPAGKDQQEFWVLNPDDLSTHKMQVRRAGRERVVVNATTLDAVRVHFSPAGILASLWGADFWYRWPDGTWVYSRLPEGGGLTVTTIEDERP